MVRVNSPVVQSGLRGSSDRSPAVHFVERGQPLKTKEVVEASDVVAIGDQFFVVGDRKTTAQLLARDGKATPVKFGDLASGNSQLEGVGYDAKNNWLFVVRESKGELICYEWDHKKPDKAPSRMHVTKIKEGEQNKGAEGLVFLKEGKTSFTGQNQVLAVIEGDRSMLLMFDGNGKGPAEKIKLDKEIAKLMGDFSAITVDPHTGHLFIASDESKAVAQISVVKDGGEWKGKLIHTFKPLDGEGKKLKKIEGITFDKLGVLHVMTENTGKLFSYARLN